MPTESRPDLTISLVNWNTRELIRGCVLAIQGSLESIEVEIIVVDNASEDGSAEMLRSEFPELTLIANDANLGFTKANNQAFAIARGRHFMLLNSDTEPLPGSLDRMVSYLDTHPEVGAVTARTWLDLAQTLELATLPPLSPLIVLCASSDTLRRFTPLGAFHRINRRLWRGEEDVEVQGIVGACFMIREDIREALGPLDEDLFMYFEDADWSLKVRRMGKKLVALRDAFIVHFHDKSGASNPRKHQIFEESMRTHFGKIYSLPTLALLGVAMKVSRFGDRIYRALQRRLAPIKPARPLPLSKPLLRWPAVPGAQEYLLEIGLDPAFAAVGGRYMQGTELDLSPLATTETIGRWYYWRVFARTPEGHWEKGAQGCITPVAD